MYWELSMSSDGDELLWQCSPGCDSSYATIFFAARRWAFRTSDAVGTYTWQISTDLDAIVFFYWQADVIVVSFVEMKLFLPKAPACEHQGLLFIFAVRDDAAFSSVRKVSTSQQPTQLHSFICLQLFVLIVMGSVRSADFVHKSAWAQASRHAIYFSCSWRWCVGLGWVGHPPKRTSLVQNILV